MTEDYKKELLNYITGNLTIEKPQSNSFRDTSTLTNNLTIALEEAGISTDILEPSIKALTSDTTSNYILYGNYGNVSNKHGFIVVCNQQGEVEKVFTTFDSGTQLSQILILNYAEDGNIYGVDLTEHNGEPSYPRIILLNNIALKTSNGYSCKLRSSYYYPSEYEYFLNPYETRGEGTSFIKKSKESATYYLVGTLNDKIGILKFTINVGSTNEWVYYEGTTVNYPIYTTDFLIEKIVDTEVIHIYYQPNLTDGLIAYDYFNGETLTRVETYDIGGYAKDIRIKSSDDVYISRSTPVDNNTIINIYELKNGMVLNLYNAIIPASFNLPFLLNYTNEILFATIYAQTDNRHGVFCLAYSNGKFTNSSFIEKNSAQFIHPCIVQNTYALYKFVLQDSNTVFQPSIVIYDSSYSGESYSNYNLLVSEHGELYSGDNIIFARKLYDKSSLNNTTTSVLEVPFNYINDISIDTQNLLSATQLEMINNTNSITKNIYENLFINFINTINVIDEDTGVVYLNDATRINNSINNGTQTNYENEQITKVRITTENKQVIQEIKWDKIDDTHLETKFTIYLDGTPHTIEFMNKEETFVYLEKDISNLFEDTYYTITEKVRLEG